MILVQLLDIVLPVFLCIAAGFAWARGKLAFDNAFVTQLVMYIGTPCLLIATFDQVRPEPAAFGQIFLAALTAFVGVGLVSWGLLRLLGLDPRDFLPALTFPNTGNMGLPLVLFAFGPEGLAFGIVVFALSAVGHFTVGISVSRGAFKPRELLTVPILPALTVGILLVVLDLNLPPVLGRTVELLGNLTIPLMLLALGVSLARLPLRRFGRAALLAADRAGRRQRVRSSLGVRSRARGDRGAGAAVLHADCRLQLPLCRALRPRLCRRGGGGDRLDSDDAGGCAGLAVGPAVGMRRRGARSDPAPGVCRLDSPGGAA